MKVNEQIWKEKVKVSIVTLVTHKTTQALKAINFMSRKAVTVFKKRKSSLTDWKFLC